MNAKTLARHYDQLTPEERFKLLVAASGRGDEAERDRLVNAGEKMALTVPSHYGYAQAFNELSLLIYVELLDQAATYQEVIRSGDDALDDATGPDEAEAAAGEGGGAVEEAPADEPATGEGKRPAWQRLFDLQLAYGYILRTKWGAWELFCRRWALLPFLLWDGLPGYGRLRHSVGLTERLAFSAEGFLRWLNRVRPAGEPERTEVRLSVEWLASETDSLFRQRARWWGGD